MQPWRHPHTLYPTVTFATSRQSLIRLRHCGLGGRGFIPAKRRHRWTAYWRSRLGALSGRLCDSKKLSLKRWRRVAVVPQRAFGQAHPFRPDQQTLRPAAAPIRRATPHPDGAMQVGEMPLGGNTYGGAGAQGRPADHGDRFFKGLLAARGLTDTILGLTKIPLSRDIERQQNKRNRDNLIGSVCNSSHCCRGLGLPRCIRGEVLAAQGERSETRRTATGDSAIENDVTDGQGHRLPTRPGEKAAGAAGRRDRPPGALPS